MRLSGGGDCVQAQRRLRRVMAGQLSGCVRGRRVCMMRGQGFAQGRGDRLGRDAAGTQQRRATVLPADDRRFHADRAGTAIQYRGDAPVEAPVRVQHMICGGRADPPRGIRRRCGQRRAGCAQQRLRHGMGRNADADRVQPRRDQPRDARIGAQRHHQCQRARPEGPRQGQRLRRQVGDGLRRGQVRHMHDQRVEAGPPLGLVDAGHRRPVARVGSQAVDRLGRDRHAAALGQQAGGLGQAGTVGDQSQGLHS